MCWVRENLKIGFLWVHVGRLRSVASVWVILCSECGKKSFIFVDPRAIVYIWRAMLLLDCHSALWRIEFSSKFQLSFSHSPIWYTLIIICLSCARRWWNLMRMRKKKKLLQKKIQSVHRRCNKRHQCSYFDRTMMMQKKEDGSIFYFSLPSFSSSSTRQ